MNGVPTFQDREEMWRVLDFPTQTGDYPQMDRYLAALRPRYSGGEVLFRTFQIPVHPVFDWYLDRDLRDCDFFERFWKTPGPGDLLPIETTNFIHYDRSLVEMKWAFYLGADLSSILCWGGAYAHSEGYGLESKRLGDAAATELVDEDYERTRYYYCQERWTNFFFGQCWDHTVIVPSKSRRLIHVMLATDTD